jgi:hypothetical protein
VLRQAARRILVIYGIVLGGTVVLSLLFGLAIGTDPTRAIAVGLYLAGAAFLVGCFVVGARGPLRGVSREGDTVPLVGAHGVRRATGDERLDATKTAILLFILGLSLVVIGSAVDPAHRTF